MLVFEPRSKKKLTIRITSLQEEQLLPPVVKRQQVYPSGLASCHPEDQSWVCPWARRIDLFRNHSTQGINST
jgi:hypothetical protein